MTEIAEMSENSLYSFLRSAECLVIDSKVHYIIYGKDSHPSCQGDFADFMGLRFGVFPGPFLIELERNQAIQQPEFRNRIACSALEQKMDEIMRDQQDSTASLGLSDPDKLLKSIAYEVIREYSFRNVLKYENIRSEGPKISSEGRLLVIREIIESLPYSFLHDIIGDNDLLLLKGVAYPLSRRLLRSSVVSDVRPHFSARIRGKEYVAATTGPFNSGGVSLVSDIVRRHSADLLRAVDRSMSRSGRLESLLHEGQNKQLDDMLSRESFYDDDRNLGFLKKRCGYEECFFIYTITPEYILWEHKNDRYYHFPPAKVGVQVDVSTSANAFTVHKPLVLNRYKHPALPGLNSENSSICFQFYKPPPIKMTPVQNIAHLLAEGCKMLMENYHSEGSAYKNIEKPDEAGLFSDYLVPNRQVDLSAVTNRSACLDYIKDKGES